mmetsp:Transcript_52460/g.109450  ORF Transcript_52460/g.109450 Transcript_52460/m.109450 type:complete len:542 (-) Transcript_52460:447-2072(-)
MPSTISRMEDIHEVAGPLSEPGNVVHTEHDILSSLDSISHEMAETINIMTFGQECQHLPLSLDQQGRIFAAFSKYVSLICRITKSTDVFRVFGRVKSQSRHGVGSVDKNIGNKMLEISADMEEIKSFLRHLQSKENPNFAESSAKQHFLTKVQTRTIDSATQYEPCTIENGIGFSIHSEKAQEDLISVIKEFAEVFQILSNTAEEQHHHLIDFTESVSYFQSSGTSNLFVSIVLSIKYTLFSIKSDLENICYDLKMEVCREAGLHRERCIASELLNIGLDSINQNLKENSFQFAVEIQKIKEILTTTCGNSSSLVESSSTDGGGFESSKSIFESENHYWSIVDTAQPGQRSRLRVGQMMLAMKQHSSQPNCPLNFRKKPIDLSLSSQSEDSSECPARVGRNNSMTQELRSALLEMCARTALQTKESSEYSDLLQNQNLLFAGLPSSKSLNQHSRDHFHGNESTISYTDGINQKIEECTFQSAFSETSPSKPSQTPGTAAISEVSDATATRLWGTAETEKNKMNMADVPIPAQRIARTLYLN